MTDNPRHLSESTEHFTPIRVVEAARATLGSIDLDPATTEHGNEHRVRAASVFREETNGFVRPWKGRVFLNPPGGSCDENGVSVRRVQKKWSCRHTTWEHHAGTLAMLQEAQHSQSALDAFATEIPCTHVHTGVRSSQKAWWQKLVTEWEAGRVTSALFVGFSVEILQTTQVDPVGQLPLEFPICVPSRRLAYDREGPCTGQCCVQHSPLPSLPDGTMPPPPPVVHAKDCTGIHYTTGASPPHASVLIYLPPLNSSELESDDDGPLGMDLIRVGHSQQDSTIDAIGRFVEHFGPIGHVSVPWRWR